MLSNIIQYDRDNLAYFKAPREVRIRPAYAMPYALGVFCKPELGDGGD